MTPEETEKLIVELRDNQVVQGYRLGRTESNLERLEAHLHRLEAMVEQNTQAIAKLAAGFMLLQAAMKRLAETVDRFVRGMEHNGHRSPDEGTEGAR